MSDFKVFCRTASLLCAFCLPASTAWGACLGDRTAPKTLTFAVVPQMQRSVTYSKWAPLLEHVGLRAKLCFDLVIPETITAFEKLLLKGQPDLAFANPYHAVMAKKRQGYAPLLMDGSMKLSGILTVKADGPITDIRDLNGKEVAFPSANAFAASLLIRGELAKQGIQIFPKYAHTHANAYRAAALGEVSAAGGVNNTWQREDPALRASLRILFETAGYAPHPLVAHPRLAPSVKKLFASAVMALPSNEVGQKLLNDVQMSQPVLANYQRDFAPLERLDLEKFVVLHEN
jgi:phosphonate transport system substrate-binding protein